MDARAVSAILRRHMAARGIGAKELAETLDEDPLVLNTVLYPTTTYITILEMMCGALGIKMDFVPAPGGEARMMAVQAAQMPFSNEIDRTLAVDLAERAVRWLRHNEPPAKTGAAMMSDTDIEYAINNRWLVVEPYNRELLQPASLDVCIGDTFFPPGAAVHGRPKAKVHLFTPGQFCLGATAERIALPHDMAAHVSGKSTWERHGLFIVPGSVAPGFNGVLTLKIKNLSEDPVGVPHGAPIAQVSFTRLTSHATRPYGHPGLGSHYQAQHRAAPYAY